MTVTTGHLNLNMPDTPERTSRFPRRVEKARPEQNLIWAAFDRPGDRRASLTCWEDGAYKPYTWDDWKRASERAAVGLRGLGIQPGQKVAAVLTNSFDTSATVIGTWLAGAVLMSLPGMRRGMKPDEYVAQLQRLCADGDAEILLMEERFAQLLQGADLGIPVHTFGSLLEAEGDLDPTPHGDDDVAFVQYSSGSTSDPKGCMLSMGAISEQARMLIDRLDVDTDSVGVMWLPFSHDMALFGCVINAWASGLRLHVGTPERFLRKPRTWMEDCYHAQATITAGPNFALALAARAGRTSPPPGRIPMRTVILGGERVEWSTLQTAEEVLGPYGITMDTLTPAYGLAENVLAVSMKYRDETHPRKVTIDSEEVYSGNLKLVAPGSKNARDVVSCGFPVDGVSLRTVEGNGVGRIGIRSSSLADGYLNKPEATSQRFVDGELITEDLGFIHDGELFVLGRTDDVIPIGGRNLHARDVELEVEKIAGVRPGCSALVDAGEGETNKLILVAEPRKEMTVDPEDLQKMATEMASNAFRAGGARVEEVVFLQQGILPKTPSGKIQRYRCKQIAKANDERVLVRVPC